MSRSKKIKPLTDTGNAERFAAQHREDVRWVTTWERWIAWRKGVWIDDAKAIVAARAKKTVRSIYAEAELAPSARKRIAKWAMQSEARRRREDMIALARSEKGIPIPHAALDADPWLLNLANGTLDLRTGELREHRREDLLTKRSPITFDAKAKCPTWIAFLERAMGGDQDMIAFLQRLTGYALTGVVREHVLVFHHGLGANGKSVFERVRLELLGSYAQKAPPSLLFKGKGERHPTEIASLHGARLVVCNEIDAGRTWDEALVKDISGGDRLTARRMREDFWSFDPTHKVEIAGNHRPRVRGTDTGIWRRLHLVPWQVTIPKGEQDPELAQKLIAELPGILNWAIEGCLTWQRDGLQPPALVRSATDDYRAAEDTIGKFFADACVVGEGEEIARSDLRKLYTEWCSDTGETEMSARALAEALRERGIRDKSVRTTAGPRDGWAGVRAKNSKERKAERDAAKATAESHYTETPENKANGRSVVTCSDFGPQSPVISPRARAGETNRDPVTTVTTVTTNRVQSARNGTARRSS